MDYNPVLALIPTETVQRLADCSRHSSDASAMAQTTISVGLNKAVHTHTHTSSLFKKITHYEKLNDASIE